VYIQKNINYTVPSHKKEPKYLRGVRNRGETSQVQGVRGNYIIGTYRVYIRASAHGNAVAQLRIVGERVSGIAGLGSAGWKCGKCGKWGVPLQFLLTLPVLELTHLETAWTYHFGAHREGLIQEDSFFTAFSILKLFVLLSYYSQSNPFRRVYRRS